MIVVEEKEKQKFDKISEITITDYDLVKIPKQNRYIITDDNIIMLIEDLLLAYHSLEEKLEELKNGDN